MFLHHFLFERPTELDLFPLGLGALVNLLRVGQLQTESPNGAVDAVAVAFIVQLVLVQAEFAKEETAASASAFGDRVHVGDGSLRLFAIWLSLEEAAAALQEKEIEPDITTKLLSHVSYQAMTEINISSLTLSLSR